MEGISAYPSPFPRGSDRSRAFALWGHGPQHLPLAVHPGARLRVDSSPLRSSLNGGDDDRHVRLVDGGLPPPSPVAACRRPFFTTVPLTGRFTPGPRPG